MTRRPFVPIPMLFLPNTKEPLFASHVQVKKMVGGEMRLYFDKDGLPACTNMAARANGRICVICGNMCVGFVANEDGTYTCSACGKFDLEQRMTSNI